MDPLRNRGGKKRSQIVKELEEYPHSFQMRDIGEVKAKALENLQNHLKAELEAGYRTSLQTASNANLLAFALFQLQVDPSAALKETDKVLKLENQQNNLVSLANKAHMLAKLNRFEEADEAVNILKRLRETPDYDYLVVRAKAELASSYLRFGPKFNKHAIDAFKEVLPHAKEPEVWTWKFLLAMAYRHALDLQHAPYLSHGQYEVTHRDTLTLLKEVLSSKPAVGEDAAHRNLQANARVEMALLIHLMWDRTTQNNLCSQVQAGPLHLCKEALAADQEDANVLWKAGKLFLNFHSLPKALAYLKKSLQLQESSAAHHHLGLTFKAMATNDHHGNKKTRRGGKREQRRKRLMAHNMKQQQQAVIRELSARSSGTERMKKVVKSPATVTQLNPLEPHVQQAIEHLKLAVQFSAGQNSRAAYDLALIHIATGQLEEAWDIFSSIVHRQNSDIFSPPGMLECVTSQEQMALICKMRADREHQEAEKKKQMWRYELCLNGALSLASELFSTSVIKNVFGEVFQSPSALLKAVEASDLNEVHRLKKSAYILSLMNKHKQSLAALRDIPSDVQDAEYYKLKIQAYARSGNYISAVTTLSTILKPTQLYDEVLKLLDEEEDKLSVFSMYLEAGKEALLDGPCHAAYFTTAFRHALSHQQIDSMPADYHSQGVTAIDADSSKPGPDGLWDVMLLFEEEDRDTQQKADRLATVLKTACKLKVLIRNENYLPGSRELGTLQNNIDNSRVVVVMPGKGQTYDVFNTCASAAASKMSSVVLLTEGASPKVIPREMATPRHPYMICPESLLTPDIPIDGPYTPELISAVCTMVKFLVNKL